MKRDGPIPARLAMAGNNRETKRPMIAITTSSSTSVKPLRRLDDMEWRHWPPHGVGAFEAIGRSPRHVVPQRCVPDLDLSMSRIAAAGGQTSGRPG